MHVWLSSIASCGKMMFQKWRRIAFSYRCFELNHFGPNFSREQLFAPPFIVVDQ